MNNIIKANKTYKNPKFNQVPNQACKQQPNVIVHPTFAFKFQNNL
jgi:hypothetical protein